MRFTRRTLLTALTALALTVPFQVLAQVKILPPCTATGNCGISDILAVFINVVEFLLSIMGAVALFMFVLGGFYWVFSAGNPKQVEKGKEIVKNAVIGIAVILLSGVIVRFTSDALTGGASPINIVGNSCNGGAGLYVLIPAGLQADGVTIVPEGIVCVDKDSSKNAKLGRDSEGQKDVTCRSLNDIYIKRNRTERFSCIGTDKPDLVGCVRGLCGGGANSACCVTGKASSTTPKP